MLVSIITVFVLFLLLELVLYVIACYRNRSMVTVSKRIEDRLLTSCMGFAFGMFVAVMVYIKLTYYS